MEIKSIKVFRNKLSLEIIKLRDVEIVCVKRSSFWMFDLGDRWSSFYLNLKRGFFFMFWG